MKNYYLCRCRLPERGRKALKILLPLMLFICGYATATPHTPTPLKLPADSTYTLGGKVQDNKQPPQALAGVTVRIKGATSGTITDANGNFTIQARQGEILVFSQIGYKNKEYTVTGNAAHLAIALEEDVATLDEAVVVGYGAQKKADLTGAVSTIDYTKELENRPITNASQALGGKVSGVWVSQNSGSPGGDGATLRVRGFGTLNNTNPLVLVDGVEGRLAELNPNDIASMTVLKDAASAAIYGSRAANGVILVTTKQGSYNSAPQLSYNGYVGIQKLGRHYDLIDNSVEFMNLWNTAVQNNGGDPLFPGEVIDAFKNGKDPYLYPNTNFFDEVFRTAPITEHNLSVRGGSEKQNYYLSANYLGQQGIIRRTGAKRYGLNFSLNTQLVHWLEIGGQVQATRKVTDEPYTADNTSQGISRITYIMSNGGYPFTPPYTRDGRLGATQAVYLSGPNKGQPIVDSRNPLADVKNGLSRYVNSYLKGSLNATVHLAPGLTFKSVYAGQFNNNRNDKYNQLIYVYTDGGIQTKTLDFPTTINNIRASTEEFYWVFYNTLNYERSFGQKHHINVIAGTQSEDRQVKTTSVQKSDPPKDGLHEVDAGTTNPLASGNTTEWRMLSYFGRINYNFNERYLLEANLRADASSRFRAGNRWGLFPSFSAGWRISEENFMKDVRFINQLKLRASWGRLGNQDIEAIAGNYPYLVTIAQNYGTSYNLGGQLVPGAAITTLVDQDITWETTESSDLGLDLGVLDNHLYLEFDYFNKLTKNILVQLPVPLVLGGVTPPVENVGRMRNKGFEISATYQSDSYQKDWSYDIGANVTYVTNQVVTFQDGKSPDQLYLIREGYSYKSLYGYKAVGIYQSDEEAKEHMANNGFTPVAGDLKYEDLNGDGKLDYQDKQVLGNTIPKLTYGLNIGVTYKNWNLNITGQGIADASAYTQNAWTAPLGISGGSITKRWKDAWTPENKSTTLPRIVINDTWNRYESSFWITDISFLKIKNIQLTYNLPEKWLSGIGLKSAACYLNWQNAYTFVSNKYEGFDPERDTFTDGGGQYPTPTIATFGVNVQF
ncbi:TonB-dependent receptor [Compostibacter hankyongensis]|uniref:TonB-dependent receptor n=1 Tax=Compostibacter hankyongensis TaxID=1007089 RepID=A0ABP8FY34_9BACT